MSPTAPDLSVAPTSLTTTDINDHVFYAAQSAYFATSMKYIGAALLTSTQDEVARATESSEVQAVGITLIVIDAITMCVSFAAFALCAFLLVKALRYEKVAAKKRRSRWKKVFTAQQLRSFVAADE